MENLHPLLSALEEATKRTEILEEDNFQLKSTVAMYENHIVHQVRPAFEYVRDRVHSLTNRPQPVRVFDIEAATANMMRLYTMPMPALNAPPSHHNGGGGGADGSGPSTMAATPDAVVQTLDGTGPDADLPMGDAEPNILTYLRVEAELFEGMTAQCAIDALNDEKKISGKAIKDIRDKLMKICPAFKLEDVPVKNSLGHVSGECRDKVAQQMIDLLKRLM